jgi:hypothetical protein
MKIGLCGDLISRHPKYQKVKKEQLAPFSAVKTNTNLMGKVKFVGNNQDIGK